MLCATTGDTQHASLSKIILPHVKSVKVMDFSFKSLLLNILWMPKIISENQSNSWMSGCDADNLLFALIVRSAVALIRVNGSTGDVPALWLMTGAANARASDHFRPACFIKNRFQRRRLFNGCQKLFNSQFCHHVFWWGHCRWHCYLKTWKVLGSIYVWILSWSGRSWVFHTPKTCKWKESEILIGCA